MARTLGGRVRERRKELGMTQEELAAALGVTQPTISRIEQGGDITLTTADRLAAVLRLKPRVLRLLPLTAPQDPAASGVL